MTTRDHRIDSVSSKLPNGSLKSDVIGKKKLQTPPPSLLPPSLPLYRSRQMFSKIRNCSAVTNESYVTLKSWGIHLLLTGEPQEDPEGSWKVLKFLLKNLIDAQKIPEDPPKKSCKVPVFFFLIWRRSWLVFRILRWDVKNPRKIVTESMKMKMEAIDSSTAWKCSKNSSKFLKI